MATSHETLVQPAERQLPAGTETLYEIVDGRVVEKAPMGAFEIWIANLLKDRLSEHVRSAGLGRAVHEMLFDLAPLNRQRRPDVSFVSFDRWPKGKPVPRTNAWAVIPDLAVEVVSPSNSWDETIGKLREYFQAGVRRAWVVVPREEQIYVYRSPKQIEVLTRDDELIGDDVVPQFRLPLADLFEETEGEPAEGGAQAAKRNDPPNGTEPSDSPEEKQ